MHAFVSVLMNRLTNKLCKSCLKNVATFKGGSHVIPRWLMKLAKADLGYFCSIENGQILNKQSDIRTQFWCEECENKFARLDAFGANFFRDRRYFVQEVVTEHYGLPTLFELHRGDHFPEVKSFIESLVIRHYLYCIEQNFSKQKMELFEKQLFSYRAGDPVHIRIVNMAALRGTVMIGAGG
jgi:hypothetical protein